MKRLTAVMVVCAVALMCAVQASAQKYGVIGGATFSSMNGVENSDKTGWNIGATAQLDLPLGFSIQPSLIYNSKSSEVDLNLLKAGLDVGYLELPVAVQWGPDLLIFRPFVEVAPYIGCALTSKVEAGTLLSASEWKTSNLQRFEYGLGLGGGIEIWRLQLTCRYNWNFGPLFNESAQMELVDLKDALGDKNFGGVTLTLAVLFGK